MRLATLGYYHETNTFAPEPTPYEAFEIIRGDEIVRQHAGAHSSLTGFLEAGQQFGCEVVPLYFANTNPSGTIARDAFERISAEMLAMLRDQGPWDGVLLVLHGAAVSEGFFDADGEMAARVRTAVGPTVPIGLALDLHGNITEKMISNVTATVLYWTNPHLDARPRALECAEIIVGTIKRELKPVQCLETPPVVINIVKQFTGEEPLLELTRDATTVMARPGMLSASVIQGYPYADVPEMGMACIAVHDGDQAAARDSARWLARRVWQRRTEFVGAIPSPAEALLAADTAPKRPVVLMDVGDNIGGGSPGDSTVLLAEAKRLGVRGLLQTLYDPQAVADCVAEGVGADLTLRVGGKQPGTPEPPVIVTGHVRLIAEGKFEDHRVTHGGWRYFDGGTSAVLEMTDGHTLLLTSRLVGNTSIQQMYVHGIWPEQHRIVVAKGVVSPRPAYQPIAAEIVLVNTPGVTTADLASFAYRHRRRPLYPFEPNAVYGPAQV